VGRAAHSLYQASVSALRPELVPFTLLGAWLVRGTGGGAHGFIAALLGLHALMLFALGVGSGYVSARHALPPIVLAFGITATGVEWVGSELVRRVRVAGAKPARTRIALATACALVAAVLLPRQLEAKRSEFLAVRLAAEWLRANHPDAGAVAAGRPRVAYYSGARFVPLPSDPAEGMLGYLRARGARFVVVDDAKLAQHAGLAEARDAGMQRLHVEVAAGRTASVYELLPAAAAELDAKPAQLGVAPSESLGDGLRPQG
jgi:hypothetical protein